MGRVETREETETWDDRYQFKPKEWSVSFSSILHVWSTRTRRQPVKVYLGLTKSELVTVIRDSRCTVFDHFRSRLLPSELRRHDHTCRRTDTIISKSREVERSDSSLKFCPLTESLTRPYSWWFFWSFF